VKIWSLLPSATEILFALGVGDQVTGITHECDYPPQAATKPRVTFSHIDSGRNSADIDRQVSERLAAGEELYGIDLERLRADPPDLIVTQDLCPVCAVSPSDLSDHLQDSGCMPEVLCLNPNRLLDVLSDVERVGRAIGREAAAGDLVRALRHRLDVVEGMVGGTAAPTVLCLEWLDPLMPGGHWVPDMVTLAGGVNAPLAPGEPSRKMTWEELRTIEAGLIVLTPCGFDSQRAVHEAQKLWQLNGWVEQEAVRRGEVYVTDGNAYFSRPGPRLVDGVEILARMLHPEAVLATRSPVVAQKLVSTPAGDSSVENWAPRFEPWL
jgi:iron complex transport system substrate-binding protein